MAGHGGKREGAGRPKGAKTKRKGPRKKTGNWGGKRTGAGRKVQRKPLPKQDPTDGLTPLEFLVQTMNDKDLPRGVRYQAAKDAAPYYHARQVANKFEASGDLQINLVSQLDAGTNPTDP